jgi:hypothetical protein
MRLLSTIAFSFLTAAGVLALDSACTPGSTIVKVVDCSGAAVQGAKIDVKICCDSDQQKQFSAMSASNGEATFSVNAREICAGKIVFAGFSATEFGTGSCSAPDRNGKSRCTVQVCKR